MFSIGKMAIAMTIIPNPPSHCNNALQTRIPSDLLSKLVSIVAPVVVSPEVASKNESTKLRELPDAQIGRAAKKHKIIQDNVVKINVSLLVISIKLLLKARVNAPPVIKHIVPIYKKVFASFPSFASSKKAGRSMASPKVEIRIPIT